MNNGDVEQNTIALRDTRYEVDRLNTNLVAFNSNIQNLDRIVVELTGVLTTLTKQITKAQAAEEKLRS